MPVVYRIAKWDTVFERAESRKLKQLNWVAMPIGFNSTGYQSMLDEFGDDASSIYGAWCALTALAATCTVRGILGNSRGNPLKVSHIARMTGFRSAVFDQLFTWAASSDVAWLEPVPDEELVRLYSENAVFSEKQASSGESPDDLPTRWEKPPHTQQDITGHNKTRQDMSAAARAAAEESFRSLHPEEVKRLANRFLKVAGQLPKEFIWQTCCIGEVLSAGMISEIITKISTGQVKSPKSYIESALRKESARIDLDWKALIPLVPNPVLRETVG
jgi:hypothetical protein